MRRVSSKIHTLGSLMFLGGVAQASLFAPAVLAQRSAAPPTGEVDPAPVAPFADPDTTRNLHGHGTFTRYTTPGQCLGAVFTARMERVRDRGADTLFGPASMIDRFPPAVREIGERCRAQIAAKPVSPGEMQHVFTLATVLYDTVGGDAARDRWFAAPPLPLADRDETPAETRAKRIDSTFETYIYPTLAGPLRKPYDARAHALLAQLEAMGQPARSQRLGRQAFLYSTEFHWETQETGRLPDPQQVLNAWVPWLAGLDSIWTGFMIPGPGEHGANLLEPISSVVSARSALDPDRIHRSGVVPFADSVVKTLPHAKLVDAILLDMAHGARDGIGDSVPQLHGSVWYNAGRDTVWPVPGQFSVLVDSNPNPAESAMLRRLAVRYGPRLRMLLVLKTLGYWVKPGTETGPRTAAQEMAQDSAFYLGYRKMPVMLTVEESHFRQLPNGWWQQAAPVQYERDWGGQKTQGERIRMVLVDSTGKLYGKLPLDEADAYALIDQMLGLDKQGATPPKK